jgi:6-pyruvoyltetrahydropterin/6-carboxytetrahydropterin synthase
MFEIIVKHHFSAAHSLRGYPGKCVNTHGHNFEVEVIVEGADLDPLGLLVDFKEVKAQLNTILEELDHQHLNELEPFRQENPSTENLARHVYRRMQAALPDPVRLKQVRIAETGSYAAAYWE